MTYYYFDLFLLSVFFISLFYVLQKELKTEKNAFLHIALCAVLTAVFKYNWGVPFWGLEYEDAYAFSLCARQFSYDIYPSSFLVDAVTIGSLQEPVAIGTYGGHFITYPTFLSLFINSFGWSYELLCVANCLVSFFIMLVLAIMFKTSKYWFIAPAMYCCSPIINVFTTCMLSELFSSFVCLTFLFAFLKQKTKAILVLRFSTFFLAILCKRENLVLCLIPLLNALMTLDRKNLQRELKQVTLSIIPYTIITFIYFFMIQNVLEIEKIEAADIGLPTFSFNYFVRLFPAFVKSLFSPTAFSVSTLVCLFVVGWHVYNWRKLTIQIIYPLILFFTYLLLYSSHYRGWFFVQGDEVNEFETYRYINNFYYLLVFSIGGISVVHSKRAVGILLLLLMFSFYETKQSREYYSQIEYESRFGEVNEVLEFIKDKEHQDPVMLICDNILLYQNLCADDFCICDSREINTLVMNDKYKYYFVASDLEYLRKRYGVNVNQSKFERQKTLSNGNIIYKMY